MSRSTESHSVLALSDRQSYLGMCRIAIAALVGVGATVTGDGGMSILAATAAYAGTSLLGGFVWRTLGRRSLPLFGALLVADAAYLAWVASVTGATSPLRVLIVLHVVAVTLLASYRTAVKVALWQTVLLGYLSVRSFEPSEIAATVLFIGLVWVAVVATSVFATANERELRSRKRDLEDLAQMATELETTSDPAAQADVIATNVAQHFGARRVVVLSSNDRRLAVWGSYGTGVEKTDAFEPHGASVLLDVLRSRETALVQRVATEGDEGLAATLPGAENLVVVSLSSEVAPLGLLVVEFGSSRRALSAETADLLERFASHAALALRNGLLVQQIQELASVDALTGIANRRTFDKVVAQEMQRADRYNKPVSLILADIDHFKTVNDTLGHTMGDRALTDVAGVLARSVRSMDTVARYGGEEFAIILPHCGPEEAAMRAEELRKAVAKDQAGLELTISFGVATYPQHAPGVERLVASADEALYRSKCEGRDRVTIFVPGTTPLRPRPERRIYRPEEGTKHVA